MGFDYQSECHCSKTVANCKKLFSRLITSQNATAPKRFFHHNSLTASLITSQNATAPKQAAGNNFKNPYDYTTLKGIGDRSDSKRVVLNTRYKSFDVSDEAVDEKIKHEMRAYNIKEVIHINEQGEIRRYKNS